MNNLVYHPNRVSKEDKNLRMKHSSPVVWLTGLSGSGKSTIGNALEQALFERGIKTQVLDGDNIRMGLNKDLGFTNDDRKENMRRISEVAKLFSDSGTLTITAFISPFRAERELCKDIIGRDNFIEVFVDANLEVCESRDPKGLYKKARAGEIPMFTGIDSPYEEPNNPDIVVESGTFSLEQCVDKLIYQLERTGLIPRKIK
jgi:adenylylsulfate kinase